MTKQLSRADALSVVLLSLITGIATYVLLSKATIFGLNFALFVAMWCIATLVAAFTKRRLDLQLMSLLSLSLVNGWLTYFRTNGTVLFYAVTISLLSGLLAIMKVHYDTFKQMPYFSRAVELIVLPLFSLFSGIKQTAKGITSSSNKEKTSKPQIDWTKTKTYLGIFVVATLFISLLASSDMVFKSWFGWVGDIGHVLSGIFDLNLAQFFTADLFGSLFWSVFSLALIYALTTSSKESDIAGLVVSGDWFKKNARLLLGVLLVICGGFALLQISTLFLGAKLPDGISYADYARSGYGQLLIVSALGMSMVYLCTTKKETAKKLTTEQLLGLGLLSSFLIILASAWKRLSLYETAYGLSMLRMQARTSLIILVFLLGLTAAFVLRRLSVRQFYGRSWAVIAVGFTVFGLINPAALITSTNIRDISKREVPLDVNYAVSLGKDAYPALCSATTLEQASPQSFEALLYYPYDNKNFYENFLAQSNSYRTQEGQGPISETEHGFGKYLVNQPISYPQKLNSISANYTTSGAFKKQVQNCIGN